MFFLFAPLSLSLSFIFILFTGKPGVVDEQGAIKTRHRAMFSWLEALRNVSIPSIHLRIASCCRFLSRRHVCGFFISFSALQVVAIDTPRRPEKRNQHLHLLGEKPAGTEERKSPEKKNIASVICAFSVVLLQKGCAQNVGVHKPNN